MAGLALGKPVVTTAGHLTEENWMTSGAAVLVPTGRVEELATAVAELLADPSSKRAGPPSKGMVPSPILHRAHSWCSGS